MKLNLDIDNFLGEYWQKKPLLIRNAVTGFVPAIDANELAGLAMEDNVEGRIIETLPDTWGLHHGPFTAADYERSLPWTLLVQAVDHHVQDVAELLKLVDFLPSWRVDDVMVSYAVDGGSVGPHYDNYDVFLLQGEGQRNWQLGQQCSNESPLLPHPDLRILADFNCTEDYLLQPGDMLYIPPGIAHWGIARGECTTFSLGFRAPRVNDMMSRWVDEILEEINPEQFYGDAGQSPARSPGEIRTEDLARVKQQLAQTLAKTSAPHWFGELVTEPRYNTEPSEDELENERRLLQQPSATVVLLPSAKLAWQTCGDEIDVYANGQRVQVAKQASSLVITLCAEQKLTAEFLQQAKTCPHSLPLLEQLLALGCICIE